jgi:type III secretion protein R
MKRWGGFAAGGLIGGLILAAAAQAHAAGAHAAAVAARVPHDAGAGLASRPLVLILVMAALSLIPFALLMVTSFVRISVVLSILRSAIGTPSVPPSQVLTGLALVLTIAVMAPTVERMYDAMKPALGLAAAGDVSSAETLAALGGAADRGKEPLREFILKHTDARDRASFLAVTLKTRAPAERAGITDRDFGVIVPAFVTSELRRAFQIGFLLFIPFLVVDMVIANLLLALGMHMLSPTTVSLPFKLLLFVIADGWTLVIRGLLQSYA